MSHVYNLYYSAFDVLRRISEIKSVEDNDRFCKIVQDTLRNHLSAIPRLVMGVLECQDNMEPEATDLLMSTLLRSVSILVPKRDIILADPDSQREYQEGSLQNNIWR